MATMEEIKKLKTGDKIICSGVERTFLAIDPFNGNQPIISTTNKGDIRGNSLGFVEIPKKEPKKLGEVTYWMNKISGNVTRNVSGMAATFPSNLYQKVNIKGIEAFEVE